MKKLTYLFTTVVIICTACGKNFLNVGSNRAIIRQDYVTNLSTTEQFLNGVYVQVSRDFCGVTAMVYPDLVADNIKPFSSNSKFMSIYAWRQRPLDQQGNTNLNGVWLNGCQINRSTSFILEKLEQYRAENPVKADLLKAQALAFRAYSHFVLVNYFAQSYNFTPTGSHPGIPYIKTSDWTQPMSRMTVAEVYDNIINDLLTALPLFGSSKRTPSVMNQLAVKALLARVYLFKGDYLAAKNRAVEVATAVPFMAAPAYPAKLFTTEETEALWQITPAVQGADGTFFTDFPGGSFRRGNLIFIATKDISLLLKKSTTDVRSKWTAGTPIDTILKFPVSVKSNITGANSYYLTLFRSSEMYLTAAESYAHISGFEDSARFYLNAIRQRADPQASPVSASGNLLLDTIYLERRKEFAFEGLRMLDLLRLKQGVTRSDASNAASSLPYPSDKAISPIPEIDTKVSGITQNPGYF